MAESLRAGFEAIRKQQFEAGLSLGFSNLEIALCDFAASFGYFYAKY